MFATRTQTNPPVRGQLGAGVAGAAAAQGVINPRYGEIWLVDFTDAQGSEMNKVRPAVVISSDDIRSLTIRKVVPITGWNENRNGKLWHVRVRPNTMNGLDKEGSFDTMHTRGVDLCRFRHRIGRVTAQQLRDVTTSEIMTMGREPGRSF